MTIITLYYFASYYLAYRLLKDNITEKKTGVNECETSLKSINPTDPKLLNSMFEVLLTSRVHSRGGCLGTGL